MELQAYVDAVRDELVVAARAGGDDAEALAERLTAPLESAIRLVLLDALSTAAGEITRELAPASVEVHLHGRDPHLVVRAPAEHPVEEPPDVDDDDGATWRVTLRMPEAFRSRVEAAAKRDGLSVNAWLVRAAAARIAPSPQRLNNSHHVSGWVR